MDLSTRTSAATTLVGDSIVPDHISPDTVVEPDDTVFPCKGCGDILEEGKAFELAGHRWHIDCFRCNSCNTLLDSDANLLLLGDGSLICNNCTYSCSACGNKIEDLAILTGDQAFCASCFKCRNCKRKIENLRYARTSQGIFCMQCHESLMARRRKRKKETSRVQTTPTLRSNSNGSGGQVSLDKSLPALPGQPVPMSAVSDGSSTLLDQFENALENTDTARTPRVDGAKDENLLLPQFAYRDGVLQPTSPTTDDVISNTADSHTPSTNNRTFQSSESSKSHRDNLSSKSPSLPLRQDGHDARSGTPRSASKERSSSRPRLSPQVLSQDASRQSSSDIVENMRKRKEVMTAPGSTPIPTSANQSSKSVTNQESEFKLQQPPKPKSSKSPSQSGSPRDVNDSVFGPPLGDVINNPQERIASSNQVPSDTVSSAPAKQTIPRKEVPRSAAGSTEASPRTDRILSVPIPERNDSKTVNGKPISKPFAPSAKISAETPPARNPLRQGEATDDFIAPRAAPSPPPAEQRHRTNESLSSIQSEHFLMKDPGSPMTPHAKPEDAHNDVSRNVEDEDSELPGIFRRVSKAVKHGRSHSDKVAASSPKWTKGRNASVDISSPTTATPDSKEEVVQLRNQLRYSQQRVAELETEKTSLLEKVNGTEEIRQVNTELRQKRTTVAFLDTQREMVIRELETMTAQLNKAKDSNEPFDINDLKSAVMREFAESLSKLKDDLRDQIEGLVTKKNELTEEISTLIQMKDKGFQEYESLSSKNQQLSEFNRQLVQNIQDAYKQGKGQGTGFPPGGLGIYTANSQSSLERHGSISQLSGDTEIEPGTLMSAPKVVDIRKGQVKKFNWKKGGHTVAKNVSKGLKAFASTGTPRDSEFAETLPYGSMVAMEPPVSGDKPLGQSRFGSDQPRPGWGFLSAQKNSTLKNGVGSRDSREASATSLVPETQLFASDLTARCEYEKRIVPLIVSRCIEEVELRGMDMEGIYRKSGSSIQVKTIQANFEKDYTGCDISDPDLDIHAVTSTLKQYFRKLPNPLISFEIYDQLLDAADRESDADARAKGMKEVIDTLPRCHRDTLEYLVSHLVRVMEQQDENLMTSLNLAVVFAPTMMRPQSIEREMSDMQAQRTIVQTLLDQNRIIFPVDG